MNQQDETDALLPEWLAEHTVAIDHARLTEAIHYWRGKSHERVEEFRCMAKELQYEIAEMLIQE